MGTPSALSQDAAGLRDGRGGWGGNTPQPCIDTEGPQQPSPAGEDVGTSRAPRAGGQGGAGRARQGGDGSQREQLGNLRSPWGCQRRMREGCHQ